MNLTLNDPLKSHSFTLSLEGETQFDFLEYSYSPNRIKDNSVLKLSKVLTLSKLTFLNVPFVLSSNFISFTTRLQPSISFTSWLVLSIVVLNI